MHAINGRQRGRHHSSSRARLFWPLAAGLLLIAGCDRSPAPAANTSSSASPAPVAQNAIAQFLGTAIEGTDPGFATRFQPVRVPDELKQFTDRAKHPTRADMLRGGVLLERLRLQQKEVARYVDALAHPSPTVTSEDVE